MKVAVVHEWFASYAGSERVTEQFLKTFPAADLYALVDFLPASDRAALQNKTVHTSFIQHLPLARRLFRNYLPLMPTAIEQFDLSAYDAVISSNHAFAKGVITRPDQMHISMRFAPQRATRLPKISEPAIANAWQNRKNRTSSSSSMPITLRV